MPAGSNLKHDVIDTSLCALCGACLDWCPYIKNIDDHLSITFNCGSSDGRCYAICPRTYTDWNQITSKFLGDEKDNKKLGLFKKVYLVKSLEPTAGQQDGGTVSALLRGALAEKTVDGLLLTRRGPSSEPLSFIGHDLQDISRAAGSKFLSSPGLQIIKEAAEQGIQHLIIVGRPCQVQALRKMQAQGITALKSMEISVIGLFCMWSLSWDFMAYLQHEYPGVKVEAMAIPRHGVEIMTDDGVKSLSINKVKEYIRTGCHYCLDMTSELADISVGSFEFQAGWNTVIVRTSRGIGLLRKAVEIGLLQIEEYPSDQLQMLQQASLGKKARNIKNLRELVEQKEIKSPVDLDYYSNLEGVNS